MESKSMEWIYTLEHHLTPKRLIENLGGKANQSDVENRLETGISMFRPYFVERLGFSHKQAKTALVQLVIASDKIYDFLIESARYRGENKTTQNIRHRYLKILGQLESLLEDCGKIDSDIFCHIPLTLHSIVNVRLLLRQRLDILQRKIIITDIDEELSSLLFKGLQMLISKKGISRAEVSYTIALMDSLKATELLNTSVLEDLLCQLDFNTPTFFNYWINYCNKLLDDEPNLHRQKEILIGMEDRFNGLSPKEKMRCVVDDESICVQLKEFLKEKKKLRQPTYQVEKSRTPRQQAGGIWRANIIQPFCSPIWFTDPVVYRKWTFVKRGHKRNLCSFFCSLSNPKNSSYVCRKLTKKIDRCRICCSPENQRSSDRDGQLAQ